MTLTSGGETGAVERSRIRRALPLTAAWILAAALAVAVAYQGVSLVGREVTDQRPASLSAAEIGARLDRVDANSTTISSSVPPGDDSSDTTLPTTTTTAPSDPGPAASAPTTAAPTTTPAPPATAAPPPAPSPETRTYTLVGGTVALRFASTGVTVAYATPAAGFEVDVEPEHGNGVKVEFESTSHRSRVDGWWDNGPADRVREDEDQDD
jgi:hypothetical protein